MARLEVNPDDGKVTDLGRSRAPDAHLDAAAHETSGRPAEPVGGPTVHDAGRDLLQLGLVAGVALAAALIISYSDITLYHHYGRELLHGSWTRGLPREYPALAGVLFLAPFALPLSYPLGFALLMTVAFVGLVVAGRRLLGVPGWSGRLALYLGLGTICVLFARYDLVAALAVFVAVAQARSGRWGTAWLAAAVGAALKVFPVLLLPGFFIFEWRQHGRPPWRRALATLVAGTALALMQSAVAPGTLLRPLHFQLARGFEFSSVPGTLTMLVDPFHLHWTYAFGTIEVVGPMHAGLAAVCIVLEGVVLVALWAAAVRGRLDVATVSLAVLTAAVLADRSLAPQYLIWLAPLWAIWPLRRSWVLVAVLTTFTFPLGLELAAHGAPLLLPTVVAGARNVVLAVSTAAWLRECLATEVSQAPEPSTRPVFPCGISNNYGVDHHVLRRRAMVRGVIGNLCSAQPFRAVRPEEVSHQ